MLPSPTEPSVLPLRPIPLRLRACAQPEGPGTDQAILLSKAADDRKNERQDRDGDRPAYGIGRVHDSDSGPGARIHVDVINTRPELNNQRQPRSKSRDFRVGSLRWTEFSTSRSRVWLEPMTLLGLRRIETGYRNDQGPG